MELTQPQPLSELLVEQGSGLEDSLVATPSSLPLTLRVRCRGKIHRFAVNKVPNEGRCWEARFWTLKQESLND